MPPRKVLCSVKRAHVATSLAGRNGIERGRRPRRRHAVTGRALRRFRRHDAHRSRRHLSLPNRAETPLTLRRCAKGEQGVVVSRYRCVGKFDWMATPVVPYFYAVDRVEHVPRGVSPKDIETLRDNYRRRYLEEIAPDASDGAPRARVQSKSGVR